MPQNPPDRDPCLNPMDITTIPFNRFLGLRTAPTDGVALLSLPESPDFLNHLGTIHASAQLALAEASSGEFLLRTLPPGDGLVPVVRRLEAKFKRPAQGALTSRASTDAEKLAALPGELTRKGRALIEVHVEVLDASGTATLTACVEWFLAVAKP
jgi:acyl-coenzyme A thioesterase PaaI-like protein